MMSRSVPVGPGRIAGKWPSDATRRDAPEPPPGKCCAIKLLYIANTVTGQMPRKKPAQLTAGSELATVFELMMQQLLLLGHTLPESATSLTPQQLKILFTLDFL